MINEAAISLKQPASLAPDSTKALQSINLEQPPLYNGQVQLAYRWLSFTGFTVQADTLYMCAGT